MYAESTTADHKHERFHFHFHFHLAILDDPKTGKPPRTVEDTRGPRNPSMDLISGWVSLLSTRFLLSTALLLLLPQHHSPPSYFVPELLCAKQIIYSTEAFMREYTSSTSHAPTKVRLHTPRVLRKYFYKWYHIPMLFPCYLPLSGVHTQVFPPSTLQGRLSDDIHVPPKTAPRLPSLTIASLLFAQPNVGRAENKTSSQSREQLRLGVRNHTIADGCQLDS